MSITIEESCLSSLSFISSSNVLKLAAMLVMTLLLSSLINIQTANAQQFSFKFGTYGSGNGQFYLPAGIGVDSTGNIYVADTNNSRIQVFDSSGVFQSKFGTSGSGDGQFYLPAGIGVDNTGKIYVADALNNSIQVFDSAGTFLFRFGTSGSGDGQFDFPIGVAVDSTGKIYVSDGDNDRIQVFLASPGSPEPGDDGDDEVGGCSMAGGSVNAGQAVANALIPLIPVFAIGIRMIRRRGKKRSAGGGS